MMAHAVAQGTICALRRQIARIEGVPAACLEMPPHATVMRQGGHAVAEDEFLPTGAPGLDRSLGGGLPRAALTEVVSPATREGAAAAGFVLGLACRLVRQTSLPVLWIGTAEILREGGHPYPPGIEHAFGLAPENLLLARVAKLRDALWIAEEAAVLPEVGAVILELRGNPGQLDLTATRRLHRRAGQAGRPVFLVRQAAGPEPTAAPLRLGVSAAPAACRHTLAGPLQNSIGLPAFRVAIGKCRGAGTGRFIVEWNSHDLSFQERQPQDSRRLVSLARERKGLAAASGTLLAFPPSAAGAGAQPSRREHAARLRSG